MIEHLLMCLGRLLEPIALDERGRLEEIHDALACLIKPELSILLLLLLLLLHVMGIPTVAAALVVVLVVNNLTVVLVKLSGWLQLG